MQLWMVGGWCQKRESVVGAPRMLVLFKNKPVPLWDELGRYYMERETKMN